MLHVKNVSVHVLACTFVCVHVHISIHSCIDTCIHLCVHNFMQCITSQQAKFQGAKVKNIKSLFCSDSETMNHVPKVKVMVAFHTVIFQADFSSNALIIRRTFQCHHLHSLLSIPVPMGFLPRQHQPFYSMPILLLCRQKQCQVSVLSKDATTWPTQHLLSTR